MDFKKLKDIRMHFYAGLLFSVIIFIMLAFSNLSLAYMVALMILLLVLIIYTRELEILIKRYENFYQSKVQEAYDKLNDCVKNKR